VVRILVNKNDSCRARIFDLERDFVTFEGLHEGEITCITFSYKGDVMLSGKLSVSYFQDSC
jgi:predicted Holliday junction resolvase-like endonuclease